VIPAPRPDDDAARLASLARMHLVSTLREADFDAFTRTARSLFRTDVALPSPTPGCRRGTTIWTKCRARHRKHAARAVPIFRTHPSSPRRKPGSMSKLDSGFRRNDE
jgi:hypothetical protein